MNLQQVKNDLLHSYQRLWEHPLLTLFTASVIGVSLALPLGFYILMGQLMGFLDGWDADKRITLYLEKEILVAEAEDFVAAIEQLPEVASVQLVDKQQGILEFTDRLGFDETFRLDVNPLPHVLIVNPAIKEEQPLRALYGKLSELPGVEMAQLDLEWVSRLSAIIGMGWKIVIVLALGFSLALVLVVYNAVRLSLEHRRQEVSVMELLGAPFLFIARPYLYSGLIFGFLGSLTALLIVQGVYFWLDSSVDNLLALYGGSSTGLSVDWVSSMSLFCVAIGLSMVSALVAVYIALFSSS